MEQHNLSEGTVADHIDSVFHAWKPNLVRALYPGPISQEVLRLPTSKTKSVSDRLVWRHSSLEDYQVKKAYEVIAKDSGGYNKSLWHLIWKVQVPLKFCNLVWKLLHDSLPTFSTLRSKGIPVSSTCSLYDEAKETTSHLFLFCLFSRATWHGTSLVVHTSDLRNVSSQQWIDSCFRVIKTLI